MNPIIHCTQESQEYYFVEGCHILELWNDPLDPNCSVARARVNPGQRTRKHRLSGTVERYVILSGKGLVMVGELEPQPVVPGSVVLIPPGTDQSIENTSDEHLVFLAICTPRFQKAIYRDSES